MKTLMQYKAEFLANLSKMTADQLARQYDVICEVGGEEDTHIGREACRKQLELVDAISVFLYDRSARGARKETTDVDDYFYLPRKQSERGSTTSR